MKRAIKFLGAAVLAAATMSLLTACGGDNGATITVYNWSGYIDDELCEDFKKETGITVKYDTFDTNEAMYAIVKNQPGSYDVLMPSDYMIQRMINEGMLEKIDMTNVPNFSNIDSRFKNMWFDQNNEYFVAYMWGTVGIMYNSKNVTEPVDSWGILWDEKYKNRIYMLDSTRDTLGLALKYLGFSLNSTDQGQLDAAKEVLIEQLPLTRAYVGDTAKDSMAAQEGDFAVCYSGDALFTQEMNPDIQYVIPKEGSNVWYDGMVIPKGAKHKKEAEMFINYLSRADIGARQSEITSYSTANKASLDLMPQEKVN
ncbi:MAG: spermidine/putrescine ABC transporter substrate-binding protein, partial [Clostridiales bacterium]|nr:spermidine/putrescine ABC transporter substrate-binding protein [Clostridiales bacterium]